MKFGETLKNLRDIKDMTQQDLGKVLGVSRATIAGYETKNHQPDYEKLEILSHFFEVSIDYLLTGEDSLHIERMKRPPINEKVLDTEVIKAYRTLPAEAKQDVLKYLKLLQLNDKYMKKDVREIIKTRLSNKDRIVYALIAVISSVVLSFEKLIRTEPKTSLFVLPIAVNTLFSTFDEEQAEPVPITTSSDSNI